MVFENQKKCLRVPLVPVNWGVGRPWGGSQSHLLTFFPKEGNSYDIPNNLQKKRSFRLQFWNKFLEQRADILSIYNKDIDSPRLIAIIGVPMDIGVGYRHGTRFGPRAIREASAQFGSGVELGFDISEVKKKIVDLGDVEIHPYILSEKLFNPEVLTNVRKSYEDEPDVPPLGLGNLERIRIALEWILGEKVIPDEKEYTVIPDRDPTKWKGNVFPVILGGDHSITLPCIRAIKKAYAKENIGVIYFDAHPDYLKKRSGLEETHASQAYRVALEIGKKNIFQVGTRYIEKDEHKYREEDGIIFWDMKDLANKNADAFSKELFRDIKSQGINKIYLSIDIDVLDAGIVPGTGVPEPGGMNTRYLIEIIQNLGGLIREEPKMDMVGLDLVEVAPDWDIGNVTALAAVKIIFEALDAYFIAKRE